MPSPLRIAGSKVVFYGFPKALDTDYASYPGVLLSNTDTGDDGYVGIAPVARYPANN